jgi:hypothetical protein
MLVHESSLSFPCLIRFIYRRSFCVRTEPPRAFPQKMLTSLWTTLPLVRAPHSALAHTSAGRHF